MTEEQVNCDMNTILNFDLCKNQLTPKDDPLILTGSVKQWLIRIKPLTQKWEDLLDNEDMYIIFSSDKGENYCLQPTQNSTLDPMTADCIIPGKVLEGDFFRITVFGIDRSSDNERYTTTRCTIHLKRSGFTTDLQSYDIENETGDIFSQLMELINNCLVDVRVEGNQLLFFKGESVYYSFPVSDHTHTIGQVEGLTSSLSGKQDTLVSGTNIKTINNQSLLGSGNITIQGGGGGGSVNMVGAFTINGDGDLIVELPDGYSNPYSINGDGDLIYDTSVTREET